MPGEAMRLGAVATASTRTATSSKWRPLAGGDGGRGQGHDQLGRPGPRRRRRRSGAAFPGRPASTRSSRPRGLEHVPDERRRPGRTGPGCCGRAAPWPSPVPPLVPRAHKLGAFGRVPQRPRRPYPHLPPGPAAPEAAGRRPGPVAPTMRTPCTARMVVALRRGAGPEDNRLVRAYHRLLVWDITAKKTRSPLAGGAVEPGARQELVIYARKP